MSIKNFPLFTSHRKQNRMSTGQHSHWPQKEIGLSAHRSLSFSSCFLQSLPVYKTNFCQTGGTRTPARGIQCCPIPERLGCNFVLNRVKRPQVCPHLGMLSSWSLTLLFSQLRSQYSQWDCWQFPGRHYCTLVILDHPPDQSHGLMASPFPQIRMLKS